MFGPFEYQTCPQFRWLLYQTYPVFRWLLYLEERHLGFLRFIFDECEIFFIDNSCRSTNDVSQRQLITRVDQKSHVTVHNLEKIWITVTIWIPDTRRPDTLGVRNSNGHMTWLTIQKPDILDEKQAFSSPVFRPPFAYLTIWQPDTSPVFRWLLYYSKQWS